MMWHTTSVPHMRVLACLFYNVTHTTLLQTLTLCQRVSEVTEFKNVNQFHPYLMNELMNESAQFSIFFNIW